MESKSRSCMSGALVLSLDLMKLESRVEVGFLGSVELGIGALIAFEDFYDAELLHSFGREVTFLYHKIAIKSSDIKLNIF